jgi:hypothetical protein
MNNKSDEHQEIHSGRPESHDGANTLIMAMRHPDPRADEVTVK